MLELIQELEKRTEVIRYIDVIISKLYCFDAGNKLNRGDTQRHIISAMGLVRNNLLCSLINNRMLHLGFSVVTIRGTKYYRNISLRPI